MEFSNRFYILLDTIQGLFIRKKRGEELGEYLPTREQAKRLAKTFGVCGIFRGYRKRQGRKRPANKYSRTCRFYERDDFNVQIDSIRQAGIFAGRNRPEKRTSPKGI